MDSDTAKLTTPVPKRKGILRMLKKELGQERREHRRGGSRPQEPPQAAPPRPRHDAVSYNGREVSLIDPAPVYATPLPRSQRRPPPPGTAPSRDAAAISGHNVRTSAPQVSRQDTRQRHTSHERRQSSPVRAGPGHIQHTAVDSSTRRSHFGTIRSPVYESPADWPRDAPPTKTPSSVVTSELPKAPSTTRPRPTASRSAEHEDSASSSSGSRAPHEDEPFSDHQRQAQAEVTSGDQAASSKPKSQLRVQYADEPWTIRTDSYFVYGPSFRASGRRRQWWDTMRSRLGGLRRLNTVWINVALLLLFVANILYMTAFCTNSWGVLYLPATPSDGKVSSLTQGNPGDSGQRYGAQHAPPAVNQTLLELIKDTWRELSQRLYPDTESTASPGVPPARSTRDVKVQASSDDHSDFWSFGLWQCCRHSDKLCLGIRFSAFYSFTRTFSVLGLFAMVLSFAWMLGHSLEKLLDYDVCTMSCLISLSYATGLFTTMAVTSFGIRWPVVFAHEFDGTSPRLAYSFYLALSTIPLSLGAGVCGTVDLVRRQRREKQYYTDDELAFMDDNEHAALPTDNLSRPKQHRKKRRGGGQQHQSLRYSTTETPS